MRHLTYENGLGAMTRLLLTLLVAFVPLANADYSSCILENMKGVGSDLAAKEIQQACTIKWSADKATNSSNSPLEAIDLKVEGSADPKTKIHENLIEAAAAGIVVKPEQSQVDDYIPLRNREDGPICARYVMAPTETVYLEALTPGVDRCFAHTVLLCHLRDWHLISLSEDPDNLLVAVSALLHGNSLLGAPYSQVSTGPKNGRQVRGFRLSKGDGLVL
jgi:hypothetical protein